MTETELGFPLPSQGRSPANTLESPERLQHAGIAPAIHDLLVRARPARGADTSQDQPSLTTFEARILDAAAARPRRARGDTSLVLVGGFAGSGKTEFGQLLEAEPPP
jgi:hypothetical protein